MTYQFVQAYHDLGPAKGPRLAMCWHMAEGGGTVSYLSKPNPNGVSVHFVIEYSGTIVQMLRLDHMHSSIRPTAIRLTDDAPYQYQGETVTYGRTAARAALGNWADTTHGTLGPNHATIAVEVEGFAADGPNDAQTAAIGRLAVYLGLPANLGHRDFASYKGCPGHKFPWPSAGGHGPRQETEMMTDYRAIGEDWETVKAPVRLTPDRTAPAETTLTGIVRTVAEFTQGDDWRVTRLADGRTGFLIRGDLTPLTPGGDPTVDAPFLAYVQRVPVQEDCAEAEARATVAEHERIAVAAGADEATRIRGL